MRIEEAKATFRGPMISVATPFTEDHALDIDALRVNIRLMIDRGVRRGQGVLLVAAAGGEFPMMAMQERKEVTRASVGAAGGEVGGRGGGLRLPLLLRRHLGATQRH